MKKLLTFLPLIVFLSCEKSEDISNICIDENAINPGAYCYTVYDPVCGCDGVTYGNDCEAINSGVTQYSSGACNCSYPYSGVVLSPSQIAECKAMIQLDNGNMLEVLQLPAGAELREGENVKLNYRAITTHTSACGEDVIMADVFCLSQAAPCTPMAEPSFDYTRMEDEVIINSAKLKGDCLTINFSYGGGCADHEFELRNVMFFCGTPPLPPTTLQFVHESNGDVCQAYFTKEMSFDISAIRQPGTNSIPIVLMDFHGKYSANFTYSY